MYSEELNVVESLHQHSSLLYNLQCLVIPEEAVICESFILPSSTPREDAQAINR